MFDFLFDIGKQVTKYSSIFGKLWYWMVFGFRLVIVTSIGGAVYGDENGGFECDTKAVGCTGLCYDQFAPISHMRLWAFQIIAVATPTILFHFYVLHVQSLVTKIEKVERFKRDMDSTGDITQVDGSMKKELLKHERRKKAVGKVKVKTHVAGPGESETEELLQTRKIGIVYVLSLLIRMTVETVFIFLSYRTMLIKNVMTNEGGSTSNPFWMRVPKFYECLVTDGDTELRRSCTSHLHAFVPCYISRPTEKTYFVRYMNFISFFCWLLTIAEIIMYLVRRIGAQRRKRKVERPSLPAYENSIAIAPPAAWVQLEDIHYENEARRSSRKTRRPVSQHSNFSNDSRYGHKKSDDNNNKS